MVGALFFAGLVASIQGARVVHKVTPVEKVITLMEKLKEESAAEGQQEAKDYDEFACFCKEQADNKFYAITKSNKKIAEMDSKIKLLEAEIAELNAEIQALTEHKEKLEDEQKAADDQRAKEFASYTEEAIKLQHAIDIVAGAIKALEDSKANMKDSKLNLVQLKQAVMSRTTTFDPKRLEALLSTLNTEEKNLNAEEEVQKPHASKYASNDIIATLKGLLKTFKEDKTNLDTGESDVRNAYQMAKQARENTIKFSAADIDQKKKLRMASRRSN
jgi:chromosome segregation ATPase